MITLVEYIRTIDPFGDQLSEHDLRALQCPICGGDCAGANPPVMNCPVLRERYETAKDRTKLAILQALLREARQYVSDAGRDDDNETKQHSEALLNAIDEALR